MLAYTIPQHTSYLNQSFSYYPNMEAGNTVKATLRDPELYGDTYFTLLCADVIGCIAEYLRFVPYISETSCVVFNNDQNTSYIPAALDVNGDVIAVMTNNKHRQQVCRVDIATGTRTDLPDIQTERKYRPNNHITCGLGWVGYYCTSNQMVCFDKLPYRVTKIPELSIMRRTCLSVVHTVIVIWGHKPIEIVGEMRSYQQMDSQRYAIFIGERDRFMQPSHADVYVVNTVTGKVEVCIHLPHLGDEWFTALAKCGNHWMMMQIPKHEYTNGYRHVSVYDSTGTHIANIQVHNVNKRITKLMAHPTKPVFAVFIRGSRMLHTYSIDETKRQFALRI